MRRPRRYIPGGPRVDVPAEPGEGAAGADPGAGGADGRAHGHRARRGLGREASGRREPRADVAVRKYLLGKKTWYSYTVTCSEVKLISVHADDAVGVDVDNGCIL